MMPVEKVAPLALKRCLKSGFVEKRPGTTRTAHSHFRGTHAMNPVHFIPSLSCIVTPDRIERDMSLAHTNMLWEEQYTPCQANGGAVDEGRKTWSHERET
ncbi:hypothetical protein FIBSPDRAFT_872994 [Athelia psychrophila]|uniref:Uncharacterized protein n=1 Tax=Athelia psychrophila TaxID=1759441 RepID=A0A165YY28_9AGAM|nr:hypothetical protein FIBSPDRAFT_872994 [Fibularhizoctonia sp. CBS 109695]